MSSVGTMVTSGAVAAPASMTLPGSTWAAPDGPAAAADAARSPGPRLGFDRRLAPSRVERRAVRPVACPQRA